MERFETNIVTMLSTVTDVEAVLDAATTTGTEVVAICRRSRLGWHVKFAVKTLKQEG